MRCFLIDLRNLFGPRLVSSDISRESALGSLGLGSAGKVTVYQNIVIAFRTEEYPAGLKTFPELFDSGLVGSYKLQGVMVSGQR